MTKLSLTEATLILSEIMSQKEQTKKYKVLVSLREDLNQGWVWASPYSFGSRSVVKITNKKTNKSIYCECLEIDPNYKSFYNNPPRNHILEEGDTITMNAWYRKKLGDIDTNTEQELEIKDANHCWGKLQANLQHPQVIVRMAVVLGGISFGLGVISLAISILS